MNVGDPCNLSYSMLECNLDPRLPVHAKTKEKIVMVPVPQIKMDEYFFEWLFSTDAIQLLEDNNNFDTQTDEIEAIENSNKLEDHPPMSPRLKRTTELLSSDVKRLSILEENSLIGEKCSFETDKDKTKTIDRFHFPFGKPIPEYEKKNRLRIILKMESNENAKVKYMRFAKVYKDLYMKYHDEVSLIFGIIKNDNNKYFTRDDLVPLISEILEKHAGLKFLEQLPMFQERYSNYTVICRIFFTINKSWNGKITLNEFKSSNFVQILKKLEQYDDINECRDYFSYKHFYVIYCKFWELDSDHDLKINREALLKYDNYALSSKIAERIVAGYGLGKSKNEVMEYSDFVWFLLAEEDKENPRSIEYWFRCMDLDGDGIISIYEMDYFFKEQQRKMEMMQVEPINFLDCICQIFDSVAPQIPLQLKLKDLKKSKIAPLFFDMFFNFSKFIAHEQHEASWDVMADKEM
ncbi:hypothetical protein ROZALSC1DRAFT_31659, partial [Rozella allomycis CSF55]